MRVLFLSAWFPYPPDNGSKLRIYNLLRGLANEHDLTLIAFAEQPVMQPSAELNGVCKAVHIVPRRAYKSTAARALLGFLSPTPRVLVATHVQPMAERIRREINGSRYDLVIASEWAAAAYWRAFRGLPTIFEDVELGVFAAKKACAPTRLHRLRHELTWLKLRRYLPRLLAHF